MYHAKQLTFVARFLESAGIGTGIRNFSFFQPEVSAVSKIFGAKKVSVSFKILGTVILWSIMDNMIIIIVIIIKIIFSILIGVSIIFFLSWAPINCFNMVLDLQGIVQVTL